MVGAHPICGQLCEGGCQAWLGEGWDSGSGAGPSWMRCGRLEGLSKDGGRGPRRSFVSQPRPEPAAPAHLAGDEGLMLALRAWKCSSAGARGAGGRVLDEPQPSSPGRPATWEGHTSHSCHQEVVGRAPPCLLPLHGAQVSSPGSRMAPAWRRAGKGLTCPSPSRRTEEARALGRRWPRARMEPRRPPRGDLTLTCWSVQEGWWDDFAVTCCGGSGVAAS